MTHMSQKTKIWLAVGGILVVSVATASILAATNGTPHTQPPVTPTVISTATVVHPHPTVRPIVKPTRSVVHPGPTHTPVHILPSPTPNPMGS